jgi:hypothetical protein
MSNPENTEYLYDKMTLIELRGKAVYGVPVSQRIDAMNAIRRKTKKWLLAATLLGGVAGLLGGYMLGYSIGS